MSYDVWVSSFRKDGHAGIARETLREMFGPYTTEIDSTFWRLRYDDSNSCDLYLTLHPTDSTRICALSVHRPCGDERFWRSLTKFLRSGPFVFYAPDGPAVVADRSVTTDLPAEARASLGQPVCLSSEQIITDVW